MMFCRRFILMKKNVRVVNYSTSIDNSFLEKLFSSKSEVILDCNREDGIRILAMNKPRKRNALSKGFVQDLSYAVKELENDEKAKAVVLCSLVPKVFCAGADLKERAGYTDAEVPGVVGSLRALFQRVACLAMPTVAALDGAALGGGLELSLACDVRFAGILPATRLGLVESHWALLPGAGGSQRLPRLIGVARAKELMFAARVFDARQAAAYGVVNAAVEPDPAGGACPGGPGLRAALAFAREITTKGPLAVRQAKRAIDEGLAAPNLEQGLLIEGQCYARLVPTEDRREGMRAFAERREPVYTGR